MNILVVNHHSDRNAGDKVLLEMTLRALGRHFPDAIFTIASNDPVSVTGEVTVLGSFTTWIKSSDPHTGGGRWRLSGLLAFPFWLAVAGWTAVRHRQHRSLPPKQRPTRSNHRTLLHAYQQADMIVSCPGNFLYSSGRLGIPLLLALLALGYGLLLGKPVYTMPQSIGPLQRDWERALLDWILPHLRLVLVRDQISLDLVRSLSHGAHIQSRLAPDLAFAFQGADNVAGQTLLAQHGLVVADGRPKLGITVLNWGEINPAFTGQAEYEQALAATAAHFIHNRDGHVVLFAQVCGPTTLEDDRIPARRILQLLSSMADRVTLVDDMVPAHLLFAAYGQTDLFLGTRLHSAIFALCAGVPVIAVAYQYKTFGIMTMLDLDKWTIAIEESSALALIDLVDSLWPQRAALKEHIDKRMSQIHAEIEHILDSLAQDFRTQQ
jgi:colanic acid/amylovoran biosynthesis protein